MRCSKCGREMPDDSLFCPECGAEQIVGKKLRRRKKNTVLIADAEFQRAVYFVQNVEAALKKTKLM